MKTTDIFVIEAIGGRIQKIMSAYPEYLQEHEGLNNSLIWLRNDIKEILNEHLKNRRSND